MPEKAFHGSLLTLASSEIETLNGIREENRRFYREVELARFQTLGLLAPTCLFPF